MAALPSSPELEQQRDTFVALKKRIRSTSGRRLDNLVDDVQAMRDYPLFPYLYYELVNRNISYANRVQINAFLRDMKGVPVRNILLKKWLKYLAKNNYKTVFLDTYEPGLGTELLCWNLHISRVKNGVTEPWYQQVEVIWLSGRSLPDACNPVLNYWRKKGKLRAELAIARIGLAGKEGQRSLARYLKRFAPKDAHYVADLWSQVRRRPQLALSPKRFPFRYPAEDAAIVKWGVNRMSWRDPVRVTKAIATWENSGKLSPATLQSLKETVAISLTLDDDPLATEWLQRAASAQASRSLWRWYLANAVRKQDWSQVIGIANSMPESQRYSSEVQYWLARGLKEEGEDVSAQQVLAKLSSQRHYYGFMSAALIQQPPQLVSQAISVDPMVRSETASLAPVQRARELFALQQYVDARREWFAVLKTLSEGQKRAAADLANTWGWYDQAIVGALRAGATEDLSIRFPLAYSEQFETRGEQYRVEPSFAMAIARRESSFMQDAVSSANARGLMQVLPSTADYLMKVDNILPSQFKRAMSRRRLNSALLDAEANVEFGMGYLQYLKQKLGDNPVVIAAAYNAGWQKVQKWLPKDKSVPIDIWIDTIPYKETRDYVKAILTYQVIYDWHRAQPTDRFQSLLQMTVPQT